MPTLDIGTLLEQLRADGTLNRIARDPRAQFGTRTRRYVGAEILPEQTVEENAYREDRIRYRTIIANAGDRYSPVQLKGGALVGGFDVRLWDSDIGSELTSRDYDTLLKILGRGQSMEGVAAIINFLDTTVTRALIEVNEKWRWQAIVDSLVELRGDNGYSEDVAYANPSGHRAAATDWTDNAIDPFDDIYAIAALLAGKGYRIRRIITSTNVAGILAANTKVAARTNRITVSSGGQIQGVNGRIALADINSALAADELPAIEKYDLQYRTSTGSERFLADDVMVFIGETDNETTLDLGDLTDREVLPSVLGYTAIGRATGQAAPGRVVRAEHFEDRPPRIEAQGWQTSGVVITEPEAIAVLTDIGA